MHTEVCTEAYVHGHQLARPLLASYFSSFSFLITNKTMLWQFKNLKREKCICTLPVSQANLPGNSASVEASFQHWEYSRTGTYLVIEALGGTNHSIISLASPVLLCCVSVGVGGCICVYIQRKIYNSGSQQKVKTPNLAGRESEIRLESIYYDECWFIMKWNLCRTFEWLVASYIMFMDIKY